MSLEAAGPRIFSFARNGIGGGGKKLVFLWVARGSAKDFGGWATDLLVRATWYRRAAKCVDPLAVTTRIVQRLRVRVSTRCTTYAAPSNHAKVGQAPKYSCHRAQRGI